MWFLYGLDSTHFKQRIWKNVKDQIERIANAKFKWFPSSDFDLLRQSQSWIYLIISINNRKCHLSEFRIRNMDYRNMCSKRRKIRLKRTRKVGEMRRAIIECHLHRRTLLYSIRWNQCLDKRLVCVVFTRQHISTGGRFFFAQRQSN